MITKRKCIIPIFDYKLTIVIFDKWDEIRNYMDYEDFQEPAKAITLSTHGASITEMTQSLLDTQPFPVKTPLLGEMMIGGGKIEVNIPFTGKSLVFGQADLNLLKELLTSKQ